MSMTALGCIRSISYCGVSARGGAVRHTCIALQSCPFPFPGQYRAGTVSAVLGPQYNCNCVSIGKLHNCCWKAAHLMNSSSLK